MISRFGILILSMAAFSNFSAAQFTNSGCFALPDAGAIIEADSTYDEDKDNLETVQFINIGAGVLRTFDRDMLNNSDKVKYDPDFNFFASLEFTRDEFVDAELFIECAGQTLKQVAFYDSDNQLVVDDVGYFNAVFGIKAKYYLRQTFIRPYLVGVLGVQNGILFLSDYTKYNKGLVIGGGAGLSTVLFDRVKLALEGRFNLGFGLWDDAPVFNSSGVSFNANYAYALFTIGYRVGS